jgi:hypothetical protein
MIANASISPAAGHSVIQILADYKRLSAVQAAGRFGSRASAMGRNIWLSTGQQPGARSRLLLCRQCCSGWVPQAGLFTGSGVAMMTWRLRPLAFMTQSLSMPARKS